jgi:methylenetetrahydrofolate reductase (NADPH)
VNVLNSTTPVIPEVWHDPTISFEYFPPKDAEGEAKLLSTITELNNYKPDFVSVTYGAGGTTRDRTIRIASEIIKNNHCPTVGHLTCVSSTKDEITEVLKDYRSVGISGILALRGDPVGGPTAQWITTPGGFDYADQLVSHIADFGGFDIGVAAFPDVHPASNGNFAQDIEVLLKKEQLGATFAVTQFVFDSGRYEALVSALRKRGSKLKVYPGIMPVSNYMQIVRMLELSGGYMPNAMRMRFARYQNDPESLRKLGIEIAVHVCEDVYALGAEGLHFYTLNAAGPTIEILQNLSMVSHKTN